MHAFNKYPQTNNWIHFHGMRGVSLGPAGNEDVKEGRKESLYEIRIKIQLVNSHESWIWDLSSDVSHAFPLIRVTVLGHESSS